MASSILETLRGNHEGIEICEKAIAKLIADKESKLRTKIQCEYGISELLSRMTQKAEQCLEIYKDEDELRKEEISFLAGHNDKRDGSRGSDVWTNFYDTVKSIRDYHKKFDTQNAYPEIQDVNYYVQDVITVADAELTFSTTENTGKTIDLNSNYLEFINLKKYRNYRMNEHRLSETARQMKKGVQQETQDNYLHTFVDIDYITYLKTFMKFSEIPRHCKYKDNEYTNYITRLLQYLQDFFERRNPLSNHAEVIAQFTEEFEKNFAECRIVEWIEPSHKLKLYSVPTDHLFASIGTLEAHQKGKKYKKALESMMLETPAQQDKRVLDSIECDYLLASTEYLIQKYGEALADAIEKSIESLHKIQSRTADEIEENEEKEVSDEEAQELVLSDPESDDERPIYNPLNLPVGWDGKPIPFWLYKLHGLGTEFKCEICGNYSYWGRRAFERHFQEWRHAFGMRCLKIPNTTHFKEVTRIEDAITLYEKLKKEADLMAFKLEQEIECEDAQGNVMSARAYEDMLRQGLL